MTPTDLTDAIEAALPYVPAGITSGDLTEPEDRRAFAERLTLIYAAATTPRLSDRALCAPESDERLNRAYSPPPAKGTHESDLSLAHVCRLAPLDTPLSDHPDPDIYLTARDWSRSL